MNNRNWEEEIKNRVDWIKQVLSEAHAKGVIFGNSGGKDCAVVAALCKLATDNVLGVILPCNNMGQDREDAINFAREFNIESKEIDLTNIYNNMVKAIEKENDQPLELLPKSNIKPRIRMTTLYTIGQQRGYLVAGTSNKSEITMGYFTKWGDGASDFNPISDLTMREVLELGRALNVPDYILKKTPSAGLWPGQSDEEEMGITYKAIDDYILYGTGNKEDIKKIDGYYNRTAHKRSMPKTYKPN